MANIDSYETGTEWDEDPSVVVLIKDLLVSHMSLCDPLERLQIVRNAVMKFHLPVLSKSWYRDCQRYKALHPILHKMKSSSLDLIITLICAQKYVVDLVLQNNISVEVFVGNHILLATVYAMNHILAARDMFLAPHIKGNIMPILHILNKLNSMYHGILEKYILDLGPDKNGDQDFKNKKLRFSSPDELMGNIPDNECSICINVDITSQDFALLDNCKHVFCPPCISMWFERR